MLDYKEFNKLTIRNKYPLPLIDDFFDQLHRATVFSQMDLATGFHQLRVAKDSIPLTAFRGLDYFFKLLVISFRLTNAPTYFVDLVNHVFRDVLNKYILVFIVDVLTYFKSEEEHKHHLKVVLETLRRFF